MSGRHSGFISNQANDPLHLLMQEHIGYISQPEIPESVLDGLPQVEISSAKPTAYDDARNHS